MKTKKVINNTTMTNVELYEGETIETKVRRIVLNKEPITDGAPMIYTEKKDGVLAQHDIRTDRFEIALEAQDLLVKNQNAKNQAVADTKNTEQIADKPAISE